MIERILHPHNLRVALKRVKANKGSAGVDRMNIHQLEGHLKRHWTGISTSILEETYTPQAILGVEIPKGGGKTRLLGVPTVTERFFQQAVSQYLMLSFEKEFSPHSYGFRPNRNARQAVGKALEHIHEGYRFIADVDLKSFFDEVDHCLLLNLVHKKVKCKTTMRLIRKWLRAPMMRNGKLVKRRKGVPQGAPISPLLSNILLNELDKELERRNLRFLRYADDFSIYTRTKDQATAAKNAITHFLKTRLKLKVNEEKSGVRRPTQFTLLGFGFVSTYQKGAKNKYQLVVSEKSLKNLKNRLKEVTRKTTPMSFDERISKITEIQRGWLNYFRGTRIQGKLKELDGWLRNRLRYCIWHHWKKPERRRKNFIRLGVNHDDAYAWSRSRKGGWAIAQSPIMGTTITLKRLRKRKYVALLDEYETINPSFYEPPYT